MHILDYDLAQVLKCSSAQVLKCSSAQVLKCSAASAYSRWGWMLAFDYAAIAHRYVATIFYLMLD